MVEITFLFVVIAIIFSCQILLVQCDLDYITNGGKYK